MKKYVYPGKIVNWPSEKNPQLDWFLKAARKEELKEIIEGKGKQNPCVRLHGKGPDGAKCKECRLFIRRGGHAKTYFKCELRGITNGPGTDHRANWPACGKFCSLRAGLAPF